MSRSAGRICARRQYGPNGLGWAYITEMSFGIGITAPGETGSRLREYWAKFSQFESVPSIAVLNHPPLVTLAVYDSIPERQLRDALHSAFCAHTHIRLRFSKLAFFETPELVFWAAPVWAITPSATRGVLNDALSIYFADATLANAFVARWCVGSRVATAGGVFKVREDEPKARVSAGPDKTP